MATGGAGGEPGQFAPPALGDSTGDASGDPTPGAEAPVVPAPEAPGPGPWAADLERFPEEVRPTVDAYMRETVQPRITHLEQQVLPEGHRQFWLDFEENPDAALLDLVDEAYGEEARAYIELGLQYVNGEQPDPAVAAVEQTPQEPQYAQLSPEDQEVIDLQRAEHEDSVYEGALEGLKEEHPDHFPADWDVDQLAQVMSPFVLAQPDHLSDEEALEGAFEQYRAAYDLIHGAQPGTEGAAAEAAATLTPEQVAALNAEAGGVPTVAGGQHGATQGQPEYASIGDAVKAFANEQAAKNQLAPPTV